MILISESYRQLTVDLVSFHLLDISLAFVTKSGRVKRSFLQLLTFLSYSLVA